MVSHLPSTKTPVMFASIYHTYGPVMGSFGNSARWIFQHAMARHVFFFLNQRMNHIFGEDPRPHWKRKGATYTPVLDGSSQFYAMA